MKIQEMKSGSLHLNKRSENERRENIFETRAADGSVRSFEPAPLPVLLTELEQPRWSVVSFDQREAGGLTYGQAAALMTELDSHGVSGLCIVTDEAAARLDKNTTPEPAV